jgi:hypothetical protein
MKISSLIGADFSAKVLKIFLTPEIILGQKKQESLIPKRRGNTCLYSIFLCG